MHGLFFLLTVETKIGAQELMEVSLAGILVNNDAFGKLAFQSIWIVQLLNIHAKKYRLGRGKCNAIYMSYL